MFASAGRPVSLHVSQVLGGGHLQPEVADETDHRAKTLEEVVKHYQSFFFFINVIRGFPLPQIPDEDVAPIVAYMKKAF